MPNNYLASVGILCYNQEQYIRQTIEAALNQRTSFPFEVWIGDDASSDDTRKIAEEYERSHPEIVKLLPKGPNKGVVLNCCEIIKNVEGKYTAMCSGDDYWHNPLKLQMEVEFLEQNTDFGLVHTDANYFFEKTGFLVEYMNRKNKMTIKDGDVFNELLTGEFHINALTACFRTELLRGKNNLDLFYSLGFNLEDYPMWLEISRHTKVKYLDESTATYRILGDSISRPADPDKKFKYADGINKIRQFFCQEYNVDESIRHQVNIEHWEKIFRLSYKMLKYNEAYPVFQQLKKAGLATSKMQLQLALLRYPAVCSIAQKISRSFKPKLERQNMS
ncbi:MAG TPA: glycosyltransferase [Chitinophagaceae bacterium]|jgi:glycosyltransferase involved in cell wall biosynthesis|nr:glycosyltransferase [Chitinophagaceae bacterium]